MILLLIGFAIILSRNRKEKSDWSESFEVCLSLITAVRIIFSQTEIQMDGVIVEYLKYCRKTVNFWNKGTFTLASSVQDVPAIFKLNGMQSFGKALVDL